MEQNKNNSLDVRGLDDADDLDGIPEDASAERASFPPGHPVSWGALIAGTVLDGCAFVHPANGLIAGRGGLPA